MLEVNCQKAYDLIKTRARNNTEFGSIDLIKIESVRQVTRLSFLSQDIQNFFIYYESFSGNDFTPDPKDATAFIKIDDIHEKSSKWLEVATTSQNKDQVTLYHDRKSNLEKYLFSNVVKKHLRNAGINRVNIIIGINDAKDIVNTIIDQYENSRSIPEQVESPIITDIHQDILVMVDGKDLTSSIPLGDMPSYIKDQIVLIVRELEISNVGPRVISIFMETENLLKNFSVSRVLALGSHLNLLEISKERIVSEISDPLHDRINVMCSSIRGMVNSFEEWHNYVRQSVIFYAEIENKKLSMLNSANDLSAVLYDNAASDPLISKRMERMLVDSEDKDSVRSGINLMSLSRSIKNIGISAVSFVLNAIRKLPSEPFGVKFLHIGRLCCKIFLKIVNAAKYYPDLAWINAYSIEFQSFCSLIS